ncbi:hypothetical protein HYV79_02415 [Candidatus Woesearchaeota archaeon]|nr:hypothetical protein [Candidatus Woesearchaeota archaeon]
MKKRGIIGLVFLLLLSCVPTVFAYHGLSGGLPLYPGALTFDKIVYGEDKDGDYLPLETPKNYAELIGLPDLIISKILIPDNLPKGTVIDSFAIEIKNVGTNVATGFIIVTADMESRYFRCRNRLIAGGGQTHPIQYLTSRPLRYAELFPGDTMIVPVILSGRDKYRQTYCSRPIIDDLHIEVIVNPIGGGLGVGLIPKGRLDELDITNNKAVKVVKVKEVADTYDHTIRLVPGLNPFTIPVTSDLSAYKFRELSGCELMELLPDAFYSREQRMPDMDKSRIVQDNEVLKSGAPYLARCERPSYILLPQGEDPGPFNKELRKKGLNFLPTRMSMLNKKLSDFIMGCSDSGKDGTEFFSLVPGQRTFNLQVLSEKIPRESFFVPGRVYFATCSHGYGGNGIGYWDPSPEQIEAKQIEATGYAKGAQFYNTYNVKVDPYVSQRRPRPTGVGLTMPSAYRGYQYRYVSPYAYTT